MTIRGFKEPEAGQRLSATEMQRVFQAIETLTEITSEWPIVLDRGPTGQHIRFDLPLPFPAKITSGTNPYAWTEQYYTAAGMFAALPGGRSGTTTSTPAYERNANTTVPANTYVWLWPSKNNHNSLIYTGSTVNGSPTVSNLSTTEDLAAGDSVSGTGIPGGATIQAVVDATTITLSANATATGSASLTFTTTRGIEYLFDTAKGIIGPTGLNVGEADGNPLYTNVNDIRVDQSVGLTASQPLVVYNGTTTTSQKVLSGLSSTSGILTGMIATATGIPVGTTVSSVAFSAQRNGSQTSGSPTLTGFVYTGDFVVGMAVTGAGIPVNSTITGLTATTITLNNNATDTRTDNTYTITAQVVLSANASASATVPIIFTFSTPASITRTGNTTNASAVVTGLSKTSDLVAGYVVTGTGIPDATTIASVNSATQITLSAAATATGSSSLTFQYASTVTLSYVPPVASQTQAGIVSRDTTYPSGIQYLGSGSKAVDGNFFVSPSSGAAFVFLQGPTGTGRYDDISFQNGFKHFRGGTDSAGNDYLRGHMTTEVGVGTRNESFGLEKTGSTWVFALVDETPSAGVFELLPYATRDNSGYHVGISGTDPVGNVFYGGIITTLGTAAVVLNPITTAVTIGNGGSIKGGTSSTGSTSGALQAPVKSGTGPPAIAATAGSVLGSTNSGASGGKLYYNPTGTTSWNTVNTLEDADQYQASLLFRLIGQ